MAIKYGFKPSGCFVVLDTDTPWWSVAYKSSTLCEAAECDPMGTARRMSWDKDRDMRLIEGQSLPFQAENAEHWRDLKAFATIEARESVA